MAEAWEREGKVDVRVTFREDWGFDEAGGVWNKSTGDTAGGEVVIQNVYNVY